MADRPLPGWPRCLGREEAASYLGVSVSTFDDEVKAGYWPPAKRRGLKGGRLTWDRLLIDAFEDRRSGLHTQQMGSPDSGQVAAMIQAAGEEAALNGVLNAAPRNRLKHRQSQAARR